MKYKKVFFTASPSFYKTRLFNGIAESIPIYAFFGERGKDRNDDFYKGEINCDHDFWPHRSLPRFFKFFKFWISNQYNELVLSGWDNPEGWFAAFLSRKKKNSCLVESSIYESHTSGLRALFKKLYLKRISKVYASGSTQEQLVRSLGFKGPVIKFGGCGILNYVPQPPLEERKQVSSFLYVGRLVPVKNLKLVIESFNERPHLTLNIAGFGEQEAELKSIAGPNIKFLGAIDNKSLPDFYRSNDVFVLASYVEPWGLVVEEALNNGCPVIVSNHVGCKDDLVTVNTGIVFDCYDKTSLLKAIDSITEISFYNRLRLGVSKLDFNIRARKQIESFVKE